MTNIVAQAAQTYWKNDTSSTGHLARAEAFDRAQQALVANGLNKTEARKEIAAQVQAQAPNFLLCAGTISQYVASYHLMYDDSSGWTPHDNPDLYAVVHKAYAASMGRDNILDILKSAVTADEAAEQIAALKRPEKDDNGEPKATREYGVAHALRALVKIAEHVWTDEEKALLFEACMHTTVAVQPASPDDEEPA